MSARIRTLGAVIVASAMVAGACSGDNDATTTDTTTIDTTTTDATTTEGVEPDTASATVAVADADFEATDWTEETHGNDVAPDFEEVFDDTEVKRLDLVVSEENWQLMLDDITATYRRVRPTLRRRRWSAGDGGGSDLGPC